MSKNNNVLVSHIDDVKFWQTTELKVASTFLTQEKRVFAQLLSVNTELKV